MVRPLRQRARSVWPQRWWWKRASSSALRSVRIRSRLLKSCTQRLNSPPVPSPFDADRIGRNPRQARKAQPLRSIWPLHWWWKRASTSALRAVRIRSRLLKSCTQQLNSPPVPSPFDPDRIGRNPRRAREAQPLRIHRVDRSAIRPHGILFENGSLRRAADLPLLPPKLKAATHRLLRPIHGIKYGPEFTCPVDTLLTLVGHIFSSEERRSLRHGHYNDAPVNACKIVPGAASIENVAPTSNSCSSNGCIIELDSGSDDAEDTAAIQAESTHKWSGLLDALRDHRRGDVDAKMLWYERMNSGLASRKKPGSLRCCCRCPCSECTAGRCMFCAQCGCDLPWLLGHCFGIADQIFRLLLPDSLSSSPLHFRVSSAWSCTACTYNHASNAQTLHLPLLLGAEDIERLLTDGIPPEIGELCAAYLERCPHDYGVCPMCGKGHLRKRAIAPSYSPLILLELGRPPSTSLPKGAPTEQLPQKLRLAPEMLLGLEGAPPQRYEVKPPSEDVTCYTSTQPDCAHRHSSCLVANSRLLCALFRRLQQHTITARTGGPTC